MWSIYKTLDLFKGTTGSVSDDHCVHRDELSYRTNYKKALFFFGDAKNKQDYNHLQQPLLDNLKGNNDIKFVDHRGNDHSDLGDHKKVNMRVKIKMTKEEAARLMAKCRDQKGTLEFRDVALELVNIPSHRIIEVSNI